MQLNPHHAWQHFEGWDTAGARKLRKLRAAADASAHGSIAIREYDEAHSAAAANPAEFERQAEFEELGT